MTAQTGIKVYRKRYKSAEKQPYHHF